MFNNNKNIILVGGGGFALEIYSYISDDKIVNIKGVLDESKDCEICVKHPELDYLGNIEEYIASKDDFGLICVGSSMARRGINSLLLKINLPLYTFIHSTAHIASNAVIGDGVFIGPHCIVSAHSFISDNVALNVYCGVGHGAKIGKNSVMSPYSVINGDCSLGEAVFLGSRVTLNPKIDIGDFSLVDAGSIIRENIPSFSIVSQRVEQKIFDNRILRKELSKEK